MGFYGDLQDLPLQDILYVLSSHGKSGRLTLSIPTDEITLIFDRGRVASVTTSDVNLRIGRLLIDQGYVSDEQMEQALALQAVESGHSRIGDVLVDLGFVNLQQIGKAVAAQFEASLFRILIQPGGSFAFTSEEPAWEEPLIEEIPIEPMLLNAMRLADEWLATHALDEVVALADVPVLPAILDRLSQAEQEVIMAILNGATNTYELAAKTGMTTDDLGEVLERLSSLGLITHTGSPDPADVLTH